MISALIKRGHFFISAMLILQLSCGKSKGGKGEAAAAAASGIPMCTSDGEINCATTEEFPAIQKSDLSAKIISGQTAAGVAGTAGGEGIRPGNCATDGAVGCVTVSQYPAARRSAFTASDIRLGVSVAGVAGTMSGSPVQCSLDGQTSCLANVTFPAINKTSTLVANAANIKSGITILGVAGSLPNCASDGAAGCLVLGPTYAAALTTGASAKIAVGQTLAGIAGSAPSARPADCAADGGTDCVAVNNFPATDKSVAAAKIIAGQTLAGVAGTAATRPANCAVDGGLECVAVSGFPAMNTLTAATKILSGQIVAGVSGSAALRPADCATDGATSCVAVSTYPAVNKAGLTSNASKIRSSLSVAGVSGTLVDCSSDGESGCVALGPTYASILTTGAAAKIVSGQTVGGVSGSAPAKPADCATDGGTNCVAVATYPATLAAGAAAKIVSGQTIAGITGTASGVRPADCAADAELGCVSITSFPAMQVSGASAKIAAGDILGGVSGTASVRPSDCAADGATSCVAVSTYPAVYKSNLTTNAAKIQSSLTIAGVTGTLADCSTDGGTSCVAVAAYPAAKVVGSAAKIVTGQSVAGISGSAAVKPADCAADGSTNCVAVTNYPAVDKSMIETNAAKIRSSLTIVSVTGTLADCAADGGTNCAAVTAYPAALATGAAAKILSGQSLAGIAGSAAVKPADCAADGSTACVTVTNFPSVDKSALTTNAPKIRSSATIAGVTGTLADCAADNGTGCVAVTAYPSVVKANVTAGVIKSGTLIAGITGVYPNSVYPLGVSDGFTDLDSASFYTSVKGSSSFGWFDRNGSRHSTTGDTDIVQGNIKSGVVIFGETGNYGTACTADGQINCITTSTYKSVNTAAITPWDIRTGKTAGGISGSLNFYNNTAQLTTFNRIAGTGSSNSTTVADRFDTIDDDNNAGAMPADGQSGFVTPGANWLRDPASDNGAGSGIASNGICDGTELCVMIDRATGLYWGNTDNTSRTWENAITHCDGLSYGGYTDWRLPTAKEWLQAQINGIWALKGVLSLTTNSYWTATTKSTSTAYAWYGPPNMTSINTFTAKTGSFWTACTR